MGEQTIRMAGSAKKRSKRKAEVQVDQDDAPAKRQRHIDPNQWTVTDVAAYVQEQGHDPQPFEAHEINGERLLKLQETALKTTLQLSATDTIKMQSNIEQLHKVAEDPVGACFRTIDEDSNGTIDYGELHRAVNLMGRKIPKYQIKPMIREVDTNGDGRLDLDEFRRMLASESAQDSPWGMAKRTVLADATSAIDFMDDWLARLHLKIFPWDSDELYVPASAVGRLLAKVLGFVPVLLVVALFNFFELPTASHAGIIAADIGLNDYFILVIHSHSLLGSTACS